MTILRTIGARAANVNGISVSVSATIEQDDQTGQIFMRVIGVAGPDTCEHRHTIGSVDGNDALAGMDATQIAQAIQQNLDSARQQMARIVANRVGVKQAAGALT